MSRQHSPERGSGTDPAMNEYEEAFIDHKDAQTAIDLRQTDALLVSKGVPGMNSRFAEELSEQGRFFVLILAKCLIPLGTRK